MSDEQRSKDKQVQRQFFSPRATNAASLMDSVSLPREGVGSTRPGSDVCMG